MTKTIDTLVQDYVRLRDELSEKRKIFDAYETDIKDQLEIISMSIKEKADELGVDSFKTAYGTAFRNTKESYRISDWNAYAEWMLSTGNIHCVEKRPAKLSVKEIHDETGELPPGLDHIVEIEFSVRRAQKTK